MSDTQDDLTALIAELKDAQASDVTLDLTIGNNGTLQRAIEALERAHFQRRAEPVACMWPTNLEGISAFAFTELAIEEGMKQPGARLLYTSPPIQPGMVPVPRDLMNELEWGSSNFDRYGVTQRYCPICGEQREDGHAADCDLAKAMIAAANKEGA